jgi:hypothetical protein
MLRRSSSFLLAPLRPLFWLFVCYRADGWPGGVAAKDPENMPARNDIVTPPWLVSSRQQAAGAREKKVAAQRPCKPAASARG